MSKLTALAAAALATLVTIIANPAPAAAQEWPQRHVTMVIPFAVGSAGDVVGRVVAVRLSELLGQQFVVENVGGAGGMIGTARIARAAPDGYQISFASADTLTMNQTLYSKPMYDGASDFAPVALVAEMSLVMVVRKDLPVGNIKELAAHIRATPGKVQFGSSGLGTSSHLTCSVLNNEFGGGAAHVPYRGSGPGLQDLVAGNIDFFCPLMASVMSLIDNKQAKPVAILGRERSPFLPEVPTVHEQGIDKIDAHAWLAFAFPKGTPKAIVDKMNKAVSDTIDTPFVVERFKTFAVVPPVPARRTPAYLQELIERDIAKWSTVIKAIGVKLE